LTPDGRIVLVQSYDTTLTRVSTTLWQSSNGSHIPVDTTWFQLWGYDVAGNGGMVVGIGVPKEGEDLQPFLRRTDTIVALFVPERAWYGIARGISQNGHLIVGSWVDSAGASHACWWDSTHVFAELDLPQGKDGEAEAVDISASGDEILGNLRTERGESIALLWRRKGGGYVVEKLPALPPNYPYAAVRAISPNGMFAVGVVADTTFNPVAALWDLRSSPATVSLLPLPDSIEASEALAVSNTTASISSFEPTVVPLGMSLPSGKWSWRTRAEDQNGALGPWSDTLSFIVISPDRVEPGQGITIQQVHFAFPGGAQEPYSAWGRLEVDRAELVDATDLSRGYMNLFTDLGWVVQNLLIDTIDSKVVTYFALSKDHGRR